ncbi:hypothetical protein BY458DRAFT_552224 [Sporodiniella umbellata]|nr:hypothetical protein BY458DRAFT_552224 [Sporodiniella umbellata]
MRRCCIRVNVVAPGYTWTPFVPLNFSGDEVKGFGNHSAFQRPGQPSEMATAYVYLASDDSSYVTGQVIHPVGGIPVHT